MSPSKIDRNILIKTFIMNKNVINYLSENKGKYSRAELEDALKKAGYDDNEIKEGEASVYKEENKNANNPALLKKTDFWNFVVKKDYFDKGEKFKDFAFGFLVSVFFGGLLNYIFRKFISTNIIVWADIIIYILLLIYSYKNRKFIFYGLILTLILSIVLFLSLFSYLFFVITRGLK
jgi:hypothetical protein